MDSLLANYASEEEEEEEEAEVDKKQFPATSRAISLSLPNPSFDSNPHPKTSLFSSLPPPKSEEVDKKNVSPPPRSISLSLPSFDSNQHPKMSLFSSHPPPKSEEVDKKDVSRPSRPVSLSLPNPSFDSNPNPKTSFFSSLPSPKSSSSSSSSSSSFFPSLPPPKSHQSIPPKPIITPSPNPNPKKVIQFKPPFNPSLLDDDDDDDEDKQEKERKPSKETSSSISKALSSILPPPKNSLAFAPSRKSVIGSDVPATSTNESRQEPPKDVGCDNRVNYETNWISSDNHVNYQSDWVSSTTPMDAPSNESYSSDVNYGGDWVDGSSTAAMETATNIPSNENYGDYASYGNYESTWMDGSSATMASEMARMNESAGRLMRKRGRNEIPSDIVEVKQDELISNRPREDQVKLTGIAFGPSYQPVSSVKGKPSKLHKRKHQIGSLFHDMKQKEMELAERRAKGFLTKAETQAKYGW